jgi:hypothetical protein
MLSICAAEFGHVMIRGTATLKIVGSTLEILTSTPPARRPAAPPHGDACGPGDVKQVLILMVRCHDIVDVAPRMEMNREWK